MKYYITFENLINNQWKKDVLNNDGNFFDKEETEQLVNELKGREYIRHIEVKGV